MKTANVPLSQVDLRGFNYPLTPFVRKQQWHLETLQAQLGKARAAVTDAQQALNTLRGQLQTQAGHVQQGLANRPDPQAHRLGLKFLSQLQLRIVLAQDKLRACETEQARLQAACIAQQRKLDGLDEHRAQALADYAADASRLAAAQADRDWIGRMHYRRQQNDQRHDQEAAP